MKRLCGFDKDSVYTMFICFKPAVKYSFPGLFVEPVSSDEVSVVDVIEREFPVISSDVIDLFSDISDEFIAPEDS
jgi:hypothetical protein